MTERMICLADENTKNDRAALGVSFCVEDFSGSVGKSLGKTLFLLWISVPAACAAGIFGRKGAGSIT